MTKQNRNLSAWRKNITGEKQGAVTLAHILSTETGFYLKKILFKKSYIKNPFSKPTFG